MRGFGMQLDIESGTMRRWFVGADGIKRWADNDTPVNDGASKNEAAIQEKVKK